MTNEYFNPTGSPAAFFPGSSAQVRAQFAALGIAFDKFPALSSNPLKWLRINSAGSAISAVELVPTDASTLWLNVVDDFGAVGDGVADDSAAVLAAITYLGTLGNGVLFFPQGKYRLSSQVIVALTGANKNLILMGAGKQVTRIQCYSGGGVKVTTPDGSNSLTAKGIWFEPMVASAGTAYEYRNLGAVIPGNQQRASIIECDFRPDLETSSTYQFDKHIVIYKMYRPYICNVVATVGDLSTGKPTSFVELDECYSPVLRDCAFAGRSVYGIKSVAANSEAIHLALVYLVNPDYPLFLTRSGREPTVQVESSYIKGAVQGATLNGFYDVRIINTNFSCQRYDSTLDKDSQPVTYKDLVFQDVYDATLTGNNFVTNNNSKRWHFWFEPGGNDADGNAKTTPKVKNIRMKGSQYQADCSQGGIVRAISNGLFTPTKIYLDIPKVLANTEFASYPTIPWSIDSACTNIELNGDGNIVSFGDLSTQRGVDYTHWLDSPTAGNQIFKYNMRSSNSVGAATDYASIQAFIKNATDAAEAAALAFFVKIAGATTKVLNLDNGNVVLGNQVALATNATSGFAYIPTCAGTPTGTPDAYTGKVACVYDTTNNKFCVYNGAWKQTAALT